MVNTSVTIARTAGMRPIHRSSHVTGGVSTNVRRMASAIGTRTACAQYRTTTTSTHPANVIHRFSVFDVSSINPDRSWGCVAQDRGAVVPESIYVAAGGVRRPRPLGCHDFA